ncbi:phosphohydrolase [Malaciobacter mytili LMG 24559]|uniref:Phosphohydrolase n=1 Tax=Malaciobacter mytili LMG 24559 TaxID=1032238 RepID=A0AAX2AHQ5_9BACT|nr:HD domain-containing protein [Malaciobacter mytili]AXH14690.1 hypothetical protein AMYT_1104 [Malaciobacter mytili LMG 24559]RXK16244.1 phosphohydrolase [Malaciobacter mytili LMG 24559]
MKKSRIFRKTFFITLFIKQNKWHYYGVLAHTLALVFHLVKNRQFKMIGAGFLHDIAKPIIAFQDDEDKKTNQYSFHNHEELSFFIVRNWPISLYTKNLVRYHYIIRGMQKAKERNQINKYKRMKRSYEKLDKDFIIDLKIFMKYDDLAKKSIFKSAKNS